MVANIPCVKFGLILISLFVGLTGCYQKEPAEVELSPKLQAAKAKAMTLCAGCHGPAGIGTADINPNLACQKKTYMVTQLRFYRDGTRSTHPPMAHIARMLTEEEVESVSEWYSITGCNKK